MHEEGFSGGNAGALQMRSQVDSGTGRACHFDAIICREVHHNLRIEYLGELRALYAAQGDSFGDREWNALWGADFADQGLDEQQTGGRPQTGTSVQRQASPTPMVQHSFDLKEAQQSAEVLRMELSIPDAPWETISEVAGGTHGYPEMAAEAAEEVRPQCGEVSSYNWDVLRGFGESQGSGGCRMTNRDAALQERSAEGLVLIFQRRTLLPYVKVVRATRSKLRTPRSSARNFWRRAPRSPRTRGTCCEVCHP